MQNNYNSIKWLIDKKFFGIFIFILFCFLPFLSIYYYGDDALSRDVHAFLRVDNINIFEYIVKQYLYYAGENGRFFPLHIIQRFLVFYFFDNVYLYRFFVILMNLLGLSIFTYMTFLFSKSKSLSFAILLFFPGILMFFTRYDDALTSYFMFMQLLFIYLSLSLIFLKKYLDSNQKKYVLLSLLFYLFSLLTYEAAYTLFLIYPLVIYFHYLEINLKDRITNTLQVSCYYFILVSVCFIIYFYYARNAATEYLGTNINFDLYLIIITFLKQIIAAFPLVPHAYLIFDLQGNIIFNLQNFISNITILDLITNFMFLFYIVIFLRDFDHKFDTKYNRKFFTYLSIILIVCPSLIIALTSKYQRELIWGLGYLPIYISRFGLLILGYIFIDYLLKTIKNKQILKMFKITIVIICLVINIFSLQGNRNVLEHKNKLSEGREIAELAISDGALKDIENNCVVILGNIWWNYHPTNRNIVFYGLTDKRIHTFTMEEYIETQEYISKYYDEIVFFSYLNHGPNTGYAISGQVKDDLFDKEKLGCFYVSNVKIYSYGDNYKQVKINILGDNGLHEQTFQLSLKDKAKLVEIPYIVDINSLRFLH